MTGRLYFLTALFFHTFQTILIKLFPDISYNFSLYDILFLRHLFSFLLLNIIIFFIYFYSNKQNTFYIEINDFIKDTKINKTKCIFSNLLRFLPTSLLTLITSFLWHFGVSKVPINNAILMTYLSIIIVPIITRKVFQERNSNLFISTITIFIIFIIFISKHKIVNVINVHYLFILLDVILFSFLTVQKKRNTNRHNPIKILYFVSFGVTIISFFTTDKVFIKLVNITQGKQMFFLLLICIFYFLETTLRILSIRISNIKYIEPIKFVRLLYSALLSFIFLNEKLLPEQILLFISIIILNIVLFKIEKKEQQNN